MNFLEASIKASGITDGLTRRLFTILPILFLSCSVNFSKDNSIHTLYENPGYDFPYHLAEPDKTWKLPNTLVEISGLSFIDNDRLACVQDEKGNIYIFNLKTGKIESEINFGYDGDYEAIEIVENNAWVLKSNGTLYKVTDYMKKTGPDVKKYATVLSGKNNTEGLAYDPVNNTLLIACKGSPYVDEKEGKGYKAIYSFDLDAKQLDIKPFILINLDTIRYYGDATFQPSGIAIHPLTGDLFILGSVGKLLLVLSRKGELLAMIKLNPQIFRQPEGICFSPDGILYISNEGDGQEGTILKFEPKSKQ
jgi:uncharacterized protein YjiK